ncbi:hypothetical protein [Mucilaginibacter sp. UR6-11]|uniref:hypothetical protein n=1 Tax=Mucilaginibacter sp. UR6-11 TaxID=1435644 RepID=UPI001E5B8F32|nr:hypothetical protein [Mucilaginibacter sp. UR6-11]MCC8426141.1 hypothetical protein [Mucilaginibacter sp. UR6-11]
MKKSHLLIAFLLLAIYSCKKDDTSGTKSQYAKLIVGTWKSYQQNIRVYDLITDVLLKDSTINFTGSNADKASFEIYNADGSAYVTTPPAKKPGEMMATIDTTGYLNYSILGSTLFLKQTIGGTTTKPILTLTSTELELENTFTGTLTANWGLAVNTTYKIIQATYYLKQ